MTNINEMPEIIELISQNKKLWNSMHSKANVHKGNPTTELFMKRMRKLIKKFKKACKQK